MANPQPNATLSSLPHELIVAIAWLVAPDGGRKAANLRLACRAVDTAAAPCVWTAITFPSAPEEVDLLLSHLIENPHKRVEFTSSVRIDATTPLISTIAALLPTFPRLKRVHISGSGAPHTFIALPPLLMRAIDRSPTIHTLTFDHIAFNDRDDEPVWALAVPEVTFLACVCPENLFSDENASKTRVPSLTSLRIRSPASNVGEQETTAVQLAFAMSAAGRLYELELAHVDEVAYHPLMEYMDTHPEDWSNHTGPLEVVLHGLQGLFDEADFEQQTTAGIFTVGLLNWMGCVSTLSLPVHAVFHDSDQFSLLSLPNLQHLAFVSQSKYIANIPDFLSTSTRTYQVVLDLLECAELPALTTLRLRGWLDHTNVKTVALAHDGDLPHYHLTVYGLLVCLSTTGIVELRLQNSIGHPDELEECVFERDDKDATVWRRRGVTLF